MSSNRGCISNTHSTHAPSASTGSAGDMFYTDPGATANPSDTRAHWLAPQGTPCSAVNSHGYDSLQKYIEMNTAINDNLNFLIDRMAATDWDDLMDTGMPSYSTAQGRASGGRDGMINFFKQHQKINMAARQARILGFENPTGGIPPGLSAGAPTDFEVRYGQNLSSDPSRNAEPISSTDGSHVSAPVTRSGHRFARADGALSALKYTCDLSTSEGFLHYIPYSIAPKPWRFETLQTNFGWLRYFFVHMKCLCIFNDSYWTYAFVLWNDFILQLALQKEHRDSRDELQQTTLDLLDNAMGLDDGDPAARAALDNWMRVRNQMTRRARARTERILGLYEKAGYREQCFLLGHIFPLATHKRVVIDGRQGKRLPYLPQVRTYMGAAGLNDTFNPLGGAETPRSSYAGNQDVELANASSRLDIQGANTSWLDYISEELDAAERTDEFAFGYNGNACIPVDVDSNPGVFGFMNLLTTHPDQFFLDNITPAQESTLQPQIQLYKTVIGEPDPERGAQGDTHHADYNNGSSNQPEFEVPIVFNSFSRPDEISEFLSSEGQASGRRGFGAGIKSFTFTYDGSNPFAAKKSIKAQLKIFANDFAELGKRRRDAASGHEYRYLDLALKTGGSIMDGVVAGSRGHLGPQHLRPGDEIHNFGEQACVSPHQQNIAQREAPGGGTIDVAQDPIEKLRFKIRAVVGISPPPTTRTPVPWGAGFNFVTDHDRRRLRLDVEPGDSINFYDPYFYGGTYVPNTEDYQHSVRAAPEWYRGFQNAPDGDGLFQMNSPGDMFPSTGDFIRDHGGRTLGDKTVWSELRSTNVYDQSPAMVNGRRTDWNAGWEYFLNKGEEIQPSEDGSFRGTYRLDGGNEIQDALENSFTTLTLTPTTHSFEVDQDGRVVMTINYLAYVEDFFDSPSFNIFMDPILSQRSIFRRLQFSKLRATCDSETLETMKEEEAEQIEKDKIHSLQSIIRRLYEAQRVRYIKMSYSQLRSFQAQGPYGLERGVRIFMPSTERGPAYEMTAIRASIKRSQGSDASEAQTRQVLARTANDMDKEYLSYFYASDLIDVILEGIEETLSKMPTVLDEWKNKEDYPTFISDCDVEYEKIKLEKFRLQFRRFRVVLGPLEIVHPADASRSKIINLGQLPVSIKYFSEWLADQILSKDEAEMPLPNFLNAFFNLLIRNFLNDDSCFKTPATQKIRMNQTVVTSYSDYQIQLDETSNFLGDQALLASGQHAVDSLTLATYAQNLIHQDNIVGNFYNQIIAAMQDAAYSDVSTGTRRLVNRGRGVTNETTQQEIDAAGRDFMMDTNMNRWNHFEPLLIGSGKNYPIFAGDQGNGVKNPLLSISGHNTRGGQEGHRHGGRHESSVGGGRRNRSAVQLLQYTMDWNAATITPRYSGEPTAHNPEARFTDLFGRRVWADMPDFQSVSPPHNPAFLTALTDPTGPWSGVGTNTTSMTSWERAYGNPGTSWDLQRTITADDPVYFSEDVVYTMATQNPELHDTTYNFLIYSAGRAVPLERLQQLNQDSDSTRGWKRLKRAHLSHRIPHFTLGRQRGVVKEIKLTKTNSPGLQEVRFEQDGYDGLRQLREVYDIQVTLLCNPKLYPGIYIYVDPDGFFPNRTLAQSSYIGSDGNRYPRDYNLSMFGIGGYYMVIRSENKLSEGTLQSVLTAKWVASIDPESDNPNPAESRSQAGLSEGESVMCARARRSELLKIVQLSDTDAAATARDLEQPTQELTTGG